MTGATIELVAECKALGIHLMQTSDGLIVDAPHDALTPDLLDRLKLHKAELLAMLRRVLGPLSPLETNSHVPVRKLQHIRPVCQCGSTTWRDVVLHDFLHNGITTRRDCAGCGRFLDFPVWHGQDTGLMDQ